VADAVRSVLIVLAGAAAVLLGHRALRHWWAERAGRAYELPVDRTGTAVRAGAAGVAALLAAALAMPSFGGGHAAVGTRAAAPAPVVVPSPPARTPEPAPLPPEVRTLGHPAGGTLDRLRDGTRVWLPPRYASPRAAGIAFPVVVAHLAAADEQDLYSGFAVATRRGLADAFVLVLPADCARDSGVALTEVGRRYRALAARTGTGVIGVGAGAPCAVREALATTGRYGAAAGISGLYPPRPPLVRSPLPHPSLLLANATDDHAARTAALRLRRALHPHGDEVRVIDGFPAHRELFALIAGYLTEKLAGPAKTVIRPPAAPSAAPSSTPSVSSPSCSPSVSPPSITPSVNSASGIPSVGPQVAYPPHTAPQSRKSAQSP
jgi:hypothetical protein